MAETLEQAYWEIAGAIRKVADVDYTGDAVNNREIDLGAVCDFVMAVIGTARTAAQNHLGLAYAFGSYYGAFIQTGAGNQLTHKSMASVDAEWQGLLAGTTKIGLGSNGASVGSLNENGVLFRVMGFQFA